jgi:hypothetical protein
MAHRAEGLNDIFEHNVIIRDNLHAKGGTISHVPTNDKDIVNKKYVDDSIPIATNLFFSKDASDIATYYDMKPVVGAEETIVVSIPGSSTGTLTASFASVVDCSCVSNYQLLPAGIYDFNLHAKGQVGGVLKVYAEIYKRNAAGTETLLGTTNTTNYLTDTEAHYFVTANITEETAWTATDRVVTKIYATNSSAAARDITGYIEGTTLSRLGLPATSLQETFSGDHDDLTNVTASQHHTKTTTASEITDFDTEVSNNVSVTANTAHAADNTQAHSDYLLNNASDTTSGTITAAGFTTTGTSSLATTTVGDHGTASTDQVVNVCYGTGDPPTASTTTEGALFVKYTA